MNPLENRVAGDPEMGDPALPPTDNIRVNAIAPGAVATEGMRPLMTVEQVAEWGRMAGRPTDRVVTPRSRSPRVGLFLLSDAASYIRGQIVAVDDGQEIRV